MNTRPTILSVGVIGEEKSYARIFRSIYPFLTMRFAIHHLGSDHWGAAEGGAWSLHPNPDPGDYLALDRFRTLVAELRPDLVFLVNDFWRMPSFVKALSALGLDIPVVAYAPVEGDIIAPKQLDFALRIAQLVVPTPASAQQARQALQALDPQARTPVSVVAHGVNTAAFQPLGIENARREVRRRLWPGRPELEDAFIVLNANKNQPRKRLDLTLQGFAAFARDKPNAYLCLHSKWNEWGLNLRLLARQLGIEKRLLSICDPAKTPSVDDATLNLLYNATDVGVNTSLAEGWGLVSFEHAAAGVGQIVPDHSACAELWRGVADFIEPEHISTEMRRVECRVSTASLSERLERVYADAAYREALAGRCFRHATQAALQWDSLGEQWTGIFEQTIAGKH
ncbi:MAG: glycosyltransferase [Chitinophagales bacterium]|nr:glycosyltransferase [Chitinophagales bacterium]